MHSVFVFLCPPVRMFDKSLTNLIELAQIKPNLMQEETISVRKFLRDYREIVDAKKVYIISNHGNPEGVFTPYAEWKKESKKARQKIKLADFEEIMFHSGDPNLSQNIDEILYGSN